MSADWFGRDVESVVLEHPARLPAKRRRLRMWGVHASGRFDRSTARWRAALRRYRQYGSWVTGTEAAGRSARDFKAALGEFGWSFVHLAGAAVGECYATWDAAVLELAGKPFARKLSNLTWVRSPEYGGGEAKPVHALVVPLMKRAGLLRRRRRVTVLVVVHMPLDNTRSRAEAWLDCCRGLANLKHTLEHTLYPGCDVVLVGDWNKNLREDRPQPGHKASERAMVRDHLERPLDVQVSWRKPYPQAGTHGRQLIDYALARPGVITACELVADDDSSDHRGFRYRLRGWLRL